MEDVSCGSSSTRDGDDGDSQPTAGEVELTTTKKTLARSRNRIYEIRHLPEEQFAKQLQEIEREAVERHPSEESAIRQIIDAYAYGARKLDIDDLLKPIET